MMSTSRMRTTTTTLGLVLAASSLIAPTSAGFTRHPSTTASTTTTCTSAASSPLFRRSMRAAAEGDSGRNARNTACGKNTGGDSATNNDIKRLVPTKTHENALADSRCAKAEKQVGRIRSTIQATISALSVAVRKHGWSTSTLTMAVLAIRHIASAAFFGGAAQPAVTGDFGLRPDPFRGADYTTAAVMRVAPAGASAVVTTKQDGARSRVYSPNVMVVKGMAASGAAVAGTVLGRNYLISHNSRHRSACDNNDDEDERKKRSDNDRKNNSALSNEKEEQDEIRMENVKRYEKIMSTSSSLDVETSPSTDTTAAPASPANSATVSNTSAATSTPTSKLHTTTTTYMYATKNKTRTLKTKAIVRYSHSTSEKTADPQPPLRAGVVEHTVTDKLVHDGETEYSVAAKLVNGREAAKRDFEKMRSLLEARLDMEKAEREGKIMFQETNKDVGAAAAAKVLKDPEAAKKDYQTMRSLLETRIELEKAEREKKMAQPTKDDSVRQYLANENNEVNKENFQRNLLQARLKHEAADKAAIQQLREQEEREKATKERSKPSGITPELFSTIQSHQTMQQDKKTPLTEVEEKSNIKGLRLALAAAAAFFASASSSSSTKQT